jgi:hypothetical protein
MLRSITQGECVFIVGDCQVSVPRDRVDKALQIAGLPGPVSFDTTITINFGTSYPAKRRLSGVRDFLEVGIGWLVDYNRAETDFREWQLGQHKNAGKPVHPLPFGTRIVSHRGELDHDEEDNERVAEPGSVGVVHGAELLTPMLIYSYKVIFPNGTWVFINERELADTSAYTILPQE